MRYLHYDDYEAVVKMKRNVFVKMVVDLFITMNSDHNFYGEIYALLTNFYVSILQLYGIDAFQWSGHLNDLLSIVYDFDYIFFEYTRKCFSLNYGKIIEDLCNVFPLFFVAIETFFAKNEVQFEKFVNKVFKRTNEAIDFANKRNITVNPPIAMLNFLLQSHALRKMMLKLKNIDWNEACFFHEQEEKDLRVV